VEQFQSLLKQFDGDLCWRSIRLISVSFGLHISEVLGRKWKDVDRLQRTISIERGL
jgi:integrase